jgi:hypothetical protein
VPSTIALLPDDTEANAHRPPAVPTTAKGFPGTDAVTGRIAPGTLPLATCVEQSAVRLTATGRGAGDVYPLAKTTINPAAKDHRRRDPRIGTSR